MTRTRKSPENIIKQPGKWTTLDSHQVGSPLIGWTMGKAQHQNPAKSHMGTLMGKPKTFCDCAGWASPFQTNVMPSWSLVVWLTSCCREELKACVDRCMTRNAFWTCAEVDLFFLLLLYPNNCCSSFLPSHPAPPSSSSHPQPHLIFHPPAQLLPLPL